MSQKISILSKYQQKIYNKLLNGIPLYQNQMGYHTPSAKFLHDNITKVNSNTLDILEKYKLITISDVRFGGNFTVTRFYHIHGDKPWLRVPTNWGNPKLQ
jgi:hypothetical protein